MPAASIAATAAPAFSVPQGSWGFRMRNLSDTTMYWRDSATVATSGDTMGLPLDPGQEHVECYAESTRNPRSIQMIHGGSGSKSLVYDILQVQVQAVAGSVAVSGASIKSGGLTGSLTSRSGTIAAANTSQQLMAANASRLYWMLQNQSTTDDLWIVEGAGPAVVGQPSTRIGPQETYTPAFVDVRAIQIISATISVPFTCKEA